MGCRLEGDKGEKKWDNCNSINNKIYSKKRKKNAEKRGAETAPSPQKSCDEEICLASELIYYSVNKHSLKASPVPGPEVGSAENTALASPSED